MDRGVGACLSRSMMCVSGWILALVDLQKSRHDVRTLSLPVCSALLSGYEEMFFVDWLRVARLKCQNPCHPFLLSVFGSSWSCLPKQIT